MSPVPAGSGRPLPAWMAYFLSVAIVCHLGAIVALVLASPSGLWPTPMGVSMAEGPQFAKEIVDKTKRIHQVLHLSGDYHFASNRMGLSVARFEVLLKDKTGNVIKTLKFPEPDANFWVRHRQSLLAQGLADDEPVQAPQGEPIPAPGQKPRTVMIWDRGQEDTAFTLRTIPIKLVPRDRPVFRPSEWSLLLAHAYMRYVSRQYGAASVELIRHSREPIFPAIMFMPEPPQGAGEEMMSSYGEYHGEN